MSRRPRPKAVLLVALLLVMINLPWAHSTFQHWRLDREGVDVTVPLVGSQQVGSSGEARYYVSFSYPRRLVDNSGTWIAEVDRQAYDAARADHRLGVRVLRGQPGVFSVTGQVRHHGGLVITLVLDALLALLVWVLMRYRSRLRPRLRAVAVEDLAPGEDGESGALLDRVEGQLYRIRGLVAHSDEDEVLLDLGDRLVAVELDGHANPVAHREAAEVHARMIG
jgi:hypothetical protein